MLKEEIAKQRKALNLSQAELAKKIGVSRQMVSLWERGVCLPDDEHLHAICTALELPENYFYEQLSPTALSAHPLEQEIAVSSASPKKKSKLFKGLLFGILFFAIVALVLTIVVLSYIIKQLKENLDFVISCQFGLGYKDALVLSAILLAAAVAFTVYIVLKPILKRRKMKNKKEKEGKEQKN